MRDLRKKMTSRFVGRGGRIGVDGCFVGEYVGSIEEGANSDNGGGMKGWWKRQIWGREDRVL